MAAWSHGDRVLAAQGRRVSHHFGFFGLFRFGLGRTGYRRVQYALLAAVPALAAVQRGKF